MLPWNIGWAELPGLAFSAVIMWRDKRRAWRAHQHPLVLPERNRKIPHLLFCGVGLRTCIIFASIFKQRKRRIEKDILHVPQYMELPPLLIGKKKGIRKKGMRGKNTFLLFITTVCTVLIPDKHTLHSVVLKSNVLCCPPYSLHPTQCLVHQELFSSAFYSENFQTERNWKEFYVNTSMPPT